MPSRSELSDRRYPQGTTDIRPRSRIRDALCPSPQPAGVQAPSGRARYRKKDGRWEFLEVPFGRNNPFAAVNLVAVEAGPHADLAEIERIVRAPQ